MKLYVVCMFFVTYLIETQLRGDYGSTFRTGSTIIVTLDTDSGTLSFSSWNESKIDRGLGRSKDLASSRVPSGKVGTVESWGVAFEGLPLDSKLFPTVSLYQRDDRVTLMKVTEIDAPNEFSLGDNDIARYFPTDCGGDDVNTMSEVRRFNKELFLDAVDYVTESVREAMDHEGLARSCLMSLSAALSLFPRSVPYLSCWFAKSLSGHLRGLIKFTLDCEEKSHEYETKSLLKVGQWDVTVDTDNKCKEKYIIDIGHFEDSEFCGSGTGLFGRLQNANVAVEGFCHGPTLYFLEEWSEDDLDSVSSLDRGTSSFFIVTATLSVEGNAFRGLRLNPVTGERSYIGAIRSSTDFLGEIQVDWRMCRALLTNAACHLAEAFRGRDGVVEDSRGPALLACLPFISSSSLKTDSQDMLTRHQDYLEAWGLHHSDKGDFDLNEDHSWLATYDGGIDQSISEIDAILAPDNGGFGSLRIFSPDLYEKARLRMISALLHHSGISVRDYDLRRERPEQICNIWSFAVQKMESETRVLIKECLGEDRRNVCTSRYEVIIQLSDFLCSLDRLRPVDTGAMMGEFSSLLSQVTSVQDIEALQLYMRRSTDQALRDLSCFVYIESLLDVFCEKRDPLSLEFISSSFSNLLFDALERSKYFSNRSDSNCITGMNTCGAMGPRSSALLVRCGISKSWKKIVNRLRIYCHDLIEERKESATNSIAIDSFTLAVVEIFYRYNMFQSGDFHKLVEELLEVHGCHLADPFLDAKDDSGLTRTRLARYFHRDVSRLILIGCTSAIRLGAYGLIHNDAAIHDGGGEKLKWLSLQASIALTNAEIVNESATMEYLSMVEDYSWRQWAKVCFPDANEYMTKDENAGLSFIRKRSFFWFLESEGTLPSHEKPKTSTKRTFVAPLDKLQGLFFNHFLGAWIDILFTVIHSAPATVVEFLSTDYLWFDSIMKAVGLSLHRNETGAIEKVVPREYVVGAVPSRHRGRLLLLLRSIFELFPIEVSQDLVDGIFYIAGSETVTRRTDDPHGVVGREAVSLLRLLGSFPRWVGSLRGAVLKICEGKSPAKRAGVLALLNGSVVAVECLGYVLVRPSLSRGNMPEMQTASMGKGHQGFPSTIGLEAVVTGLLRHETSGGIVSGIDTKSLTCEVLVMERKIDSDILSQGVLIRAVKVPLTEVMSAQEVNLPITPSFPAQEVLNAFLEQSLSSLLSMIEKTKKEDVDVQSEINTENNQSPETVGDYSGSDDHTSSDEHASTNVATKETGHNSAGDNNDSEEKAEALDLRPGIFSLAFDLMAIRACLGILSFEHVLRDFLPRAGEAALFQKLVRLAWPNVEADNPKRELVLGCRGASLSHLGAADAGFFHIMSLLKEIHIRSEVHKPESLRSRLQERTPGGNREMTGSTSNTPENHESSRPNSRARSFPDISGVVPHESRASTQTMNRDTDINSNRSISQSTGGSDEEEQSNETPANALAGLREAAIAQMNELGIPRTYAEIALRRTGGVDIEAAVHFCLENGAEIERILATEAERSGSRGVGESSEASTQLVRQLQEMGFPRRWCTVALAATGNSVDEALAWILTNNDMLENLDSLASEDELDDSNHSLSSDTDGDGAEDSESSDAEESDERESLREDPFPVVWSKVSNPLKIISGKASIDPNSLEVTGVSDGGFASLGVKGVLLTEGKWYYEVHLQSSGCIQIGFGDATFAGHCSADRGDGCGDSSSSFSFDGWRCLKWNSIATHWGCRWKKGDVIGCLLDLDERVISFTLNGEGDSIGMGEAFRNFSYTGGLYPVVSFNRREKLRVVLGGNDGAFRFSPPTDFRAIGAAFFDAIEERDNIIANEIGFEEPAVKGFSPILDTSEEDHGHELFSWSHRYFGADASVHLGSRRRPNSSKNPGSSGVGTVENIIDRKLDQALTKVPGTIIDEAKSSSISCSRAIQETLGVIEKDLAYDAFCHAMKISILLARKCALHLVSNCCPSSVIELMTNGNDDGYILLWSIFESCLESKGWAGEAGAMAVAAESLGLGIQMQAQRSSEPVKVFDSLKCLSISGYYQLMNSVLLSPSEHSTAYLPCAAAELSFCDENNGGSLVYMRDGLLAMAAHSSNFRKVILGWSIKALRSLASPDDNGAPHYSEEESDQPDESSDISPDARLVCFCTGLLLSSLEHTNSSEADDTFTSLFFAWSLGLLSSSMPWRMVSALTVSGIMRIRPKIFESITTAPKTLARYFARLPSTVMRRIWTERATFPVCSRYTQAMLDLTRAVELCIGVSTSISEKFIQVWNSIENEPACPRPLFGFEKVGVALPCQWESEGGFVSDEQVITGRLVLEALDWEKPPLSKQRNIMDGDESPPMLRVGCKVLRGPSWDESTYGNDDGNDIYESAKSQRSQLKKDYEEKMKQREDDVTTDDAEPEEPEEAVPKKKFPLPKLALGDVIGIEDWNGIKGKGRRIKWALTGREGIYRFGGDGGKFDLVHVETNKKGTKVKTRYAPPETDEQFACRKGFGTAREYEVILRIMSRTNKKSQRGILEIPDFGAAVQVSLEAQEGGAIHLTELDLHFGCRDAGWEALYGHPSFQPGTTFDLHPDGICSDMVRNSEGKYVSLRGSAEASVTRMRNPANGSPLVLRKELVLRFPNTELGSSFASHPAPLEFDKSFHASNLSVSKNGRTVTCTSPEGRGSAFATLGFSKGVHYWEVKLEQADIGSVFIGCAVKPGPDEPARLNRWHGWGFVNFRASYTSGSERVYGVHAHSGDHIGVLLDCDAGRLSFFYDGLKYGEHILSDLGCAFENMSPFGFSSEGCSTGGQGQSAANAFGRSSTQGFVRPRTLWPVIGLRNQGDRVTISRKWSSVYGRDPSACLKNVLHFSRLMEDYLAGSVSSSIASHAYSELEEWSRGHQIRVSSRSTGESMIVLDRTAIGCAAACALLGLPVALLPGDKIRLRRSEGRPLELDEDVVILGQNQLRLFYRVYAQKNEGQSLSEGGDQCHWFDEYDFVEPIEFLSDPKGRGVPLPLLKRFRAPVDGGLKVVYHGGAVIRSDIEITDTSKTLGTIEYDEVIPGEDILEYRMNSCGVMRYKIKYDGYEGFISEQIRGGNEEKIVEIMSPQEAGESKSSTNETELAFDCASQWLDALRKSGVGEDKTWDVPVYETFLHEVETCRFTGISQDDSDALLVKAMNALTHCTADPDFFSIDIHTVSDALTFAKNMLEGKPGIATQIRIDMCEAVANVFTEKGVTENLPPVSSMVSRLAFLRSMNRFAQHAIPWIAGSSTQDGSAIVGGSHGFGSSSQYSRGFGDRVVDKTWVQFTSGSSIVKRNRHLLFHGTKIRFLRGIMDATITPTALGHDEYELPRDIRTVRVNRLKASRAMKSSDSIAKRKFSVFSQLQAELKGSGGAALRRSYVAKGHGGQKRAFKVKFVGEGVNDYSGPYREVFADANEEILAVESDPSNEGYGVLGVLDPSPNNVMSVGENRDLYLFSSNGKDLASDLAVFSQSASLYEKRIRMHFSTFMVAQDETAREIEESITFLGRFVGTAFRHGIPMDLPLSHLLVWDPICGKFHKEGDVMAQIDLISSKHSMDFAPTLLWQYCMLNCFMSGFKSVVPIEPMYLLEGEELRSEICGSSSVDISVLKRIVEYEGYTGDEPVISFLWDSLLEDFTHEDRKNFLQFVWARKRLPSRESGFESTFKIQKDVKNDGEKADLALPGASTCFFTLCLPPYTSKSILQDKLRFAIYNVRTMETDFQTNSSEIAEGYRGI